MTLMELQRPSQRSDSCTNQVTRETATDANVIDLALAVSLVQWTRTKHQGAPWSERVSDRSRHTICLASRGVGQQASPPGITDQLLMVRQVLVHFRWGTVHCAHA